MNPTRPARPMRSGASPILAVLTASLSLGALPACGSSSSTGSQIGHADGTGAKSGDGSVGGGSSAGGANGIFTLDGGGFLADAQPPVIVPDAACGESSIVATPREVSILLVIDESGSMADKPTGFSTDKWTALKTAIGTTLSAVKNDIAFGLELFPYPIDPKTPIAIGCTDNCCEMPVAPGINIPIAAGATSVPKIVAALAATGPGGGTPTALALQRAHDYFTTGAGKGINGDRYVLLATDGGPDCNAALTCDAASCTTNLDGKCQLPSNDNCCDGVRFGGKAANERCLDGAATEQRVLDLSAAGVKTFVVGIPGVEAYQTSLDAVATAGGEVSPSAPPAYFAVSAAGGTTELATVLGSITKSLVTTCRLQLTSTPEDTSKLNVLVDGARIPKNAGGWRLDEGTTPPTVELLGATCAKVETEGAQRVQILYGCKTQTR